MTSKFLNNNNGVDLSALQDGSFSIYAKSIKVNDLTPSMNVSSDPNKFLNSSSAGSGDMTYVGTTPATNYILKASSADGLNVTKSNIVDTGSAVVVITRLRCLELDGQIVGGNLNIGSDQNTVTILADCTADKFVKSGGTGIQYLMADGSSLTASASAGNSIV